jgi:hypothetical protein
MLKKNYFLVGTALGCILILLISNFGFGQSLLNQLFSLEGYNSAVPVFCGALTSFFLAFILDRLIKKHIYIFSGLLLPSLVFVAGVAVGSAVNLINYNPEYLVLSPFDRYVFTPFFWLTIMGLPSSWVVGTVYYLIYNRYFRMDV